MFIMINQYYKPFITDTQANTRRKFYFCFWQLNPWFWRVLLEQAYCLNHVQPLLNGPSILLDLIGQGFKLGDGLE